MGYPDLAERIELLSLIDNFGEIVQQIW